jgi:isopenicillin N synthase-like dioxygenase
MVREPRSLRSLRAVDADAIADTLKSTLHRVTLPPLADRIVGADRMTRERYSIVYFVGADPDALVGCLPACVDEQNPARYEPITQRAYCQMRSKVQYRES